MTQRLKQKHCPPGAGENKPWEPGSEVMGDGTAPKKEAATIAEMLDEALGNEFKGEEAAEANKVVSKQYNETLAKVRALQ